MVPCAFIDIYVPTLSDVFPYKCVFFFQFDFNRMKNVTLWSEYSIVYQGHLLYSKCYVLVELFLWTSRRGYPLCPLCFILRIECRGYEVGKVESIVSPWWWIEQERGFYELMCEHSPSTFTWAWCVLKLIPDLYYRTWVSKESHLT